METCQIEKIQKKHERTRKANDYNKLLITGGKVSQKLSRTKIYKEYKLNKINAN